MAEKAIIYCRTATNKKQSDYNSLKHQSDICRKYANKKGYVVIKEIKEFGSGNEINIGLEKAVSIVKSGDADVLIATDMDRISRISWKVMEVIDRLDRKIEFPYFKSSYKDANAGLILSTMISVNAYYQSLFRSRCRGNKQIRQKTIQP